MSALCKRACAGERPSFLLFQRGLAAMRQGCHCLGASHTEDGGGSSFHEAALRAGPWRLAAPLGPRGTVMELAKANKRPCKGAGQDSALFSASRNGALAALWCGTWELENPLPLMWCPWLWKACLRTWQHKSLQKEIKQRWHFRV